MADASGLSWYGMGKDRDKFLHYLEAFADLVAAAKPWQGLTDDDWEKVANRKNTVLDTFEQGAAWAAYKLERRNT